MGDGQIISVDGGGGGDACDRSMSLKELCILLNTAAQNTYSNVGEARAVNGDRVILSSGTQTNHQDQEPQGPMSLHVTFPQTTPSPSVLNAGLDSESGAVVQSMFLVGAGKNIICEDIRGIVQNVDGRKGLSGALSSTPAGGSNPVPLGFQTSPDQLSKERNEEAIRKRKWKEDNEKADWVFHSL